MRLEPLAFRFRYPDGPAGREQTEVEEALRSAREIAGFVQSRLFEG